MQMCIRDRVTSRLSVRMPWTNTPSTPGTLEEITVVSGPPVPVTLPMM